MIKKKLLRGETVWFRSSGKSLEPVVFAEDALTIEPLSKFATACRDREKVVQLGDIVFAEVQWFHKYNTRFFCHMVHAVQEIV